MVIAFMACSFFQRATNAEAKGRDPITPSSRLREFPAFLFIVGMSVPPALGGRMAKGEGVWRTLGHVVVRTLSLLLIGILTVHETPDTAALGWSGQWWCVLMYVSAIAAFCVIVPGRAATEGKGTMWKRISSCIRRAGLVWQAFAFRDAQGQRIITLAPFSLVTKGYGILVLSIPQGCMGGRAFRHTTASTGIAADTVLPAEAKYPRAAELVVPFAFTPNVRDSTMRKAAA